MSETSDRRWEAYVTHPETGETVSTADLTHDQIHILDLLHDLGIVDVEARETTSGRQEDDS